MFVLQFTVVQREHLLLDSYSRVLLHPLFGPTDSTRLNVRSETDLAFTLIITHGCHMQNQVMDYDALDHVVMCVVQLQLEVLTRLGIFFATYFCHCHFIAMDTLQLGTGGGSQLAESLRMHNFAIV